MTATWLKYTGRLTVSGDSTDKGVEALNGGYPSPLLDLLIADGFGTLSLNRSPFVGSLAIYATRNLYGYAIPSTVINDFLLAGTYPLATEVAAERSYFVVIGAAYNDLRSEIGVTNATLVSRMSALITEVLAAAPWVTVVIKYCLTSEAGDPAAWPVADRPAYVAQTALWNDDPTGRAAVAAAFPGRVILAPAYTSTVVYSDHVHPVDGATGYDLLAASIYTAIVSRKPA